MKYSEIKAIRDYDHLPKDNEGGYLVPTTWYREAPGRLNRFWRWLGRTAGSDDILSRGYESYNLRDEMVEAAHNKRLTRHTK